MLLIPKDILILPIKVQKHAENIYNRHKLFTELLIRLGVSHQQAEEDACRLEHVVSEETHQCIQRFLEKDGKE